MRRRQFFGMTLALGIAVGCSDSTDPVPTPAINFSIGSALTTISVARGETKTFPVTITRTGGFSGSVTISVTGLPPDLSVGCSPSAVLGSSTTLTVVANATQALGAFTATVKATGSGVASKTTILTINVTG